MNRYNPSDFRMPERGFSLFEMLAVLAIVGIILALSPALFEGLLTSSGVSGGAEIAAGMVAQARSEAQLSTGTVRLVVDADPASPNYLQRMAVAREVEFDDGSRKWQPTSAMKFLPAGVFLYLPYVGGEKTMTFQFSRAEASTQWVYFEFDSLGRLNMPLDQTGERSQIVFIRGVLDESSNRSLVVTEADRKAMMGFILRKSGSVTFFPSTPTSP